MEKKRKREGVSFFLFKTSGKEKKTKKKLFTSWNILASIAAASRLFAAVMAWMSPVRCRLSDSIGMICEYPPPAAPPLIPKVGPWLGCRTVVSTARPRCAPSAWQSPTVVVDLPSPRGVGVMPATTTYLPLLADTRRSRTESLTCFSVRERE